MEEALTVKKRLLDAAGAVFAERGYEAATVREICARAEANLAAVNYHFGDKERLYIEAVKAAHARRLARHPPPVLPPGMPPAARLRQWIRHLLQRLVLDQDQPAWCAQLIMRELAVPTAACRELTQEFIRPQFEQLVALITELAPPRTSARQLHLLAFSIVGQCVYHRLARPIIGYLVGSEEFGSYDLDLLTDHITAFTLRGLAGLGPRRHRSGRRPAAARRQT